MSDQPGGKVSRAFFEERIAPNLGAERSDVALGPAHGCDFGVIRPDEATHATVLATDPISILPDLGFARAGRFALHVVLSDVAIATVEEGAASVHTVQQYGTEEYASFTKPTGKGEYSRPREELFAELGDALAHLDPDAIILAGPGFTKQDARDYIEEEFRDLAERITTVDTSGVGDRGVHEVLKRGAVDEVQKETRISKEAELIDELTENIAQGAKATYGPEDVAEAAEFGAVETLLVVDERLRTERQGEGDWDIDVNEVIQSVERQGGDVVVFSSEFAPGEQLSNLGGIAAILRYRLQ